MTERNLPADRFRKIRQAGFLALGTVQEEIESLGWAASVADKAASLARRDKQQAGGARPNKALHDLMQQLALLFKNATGSAPKPPTYDPIEGEIAASSWNLCGPSFRSSSPIDQGRRAQG